MQYYSLKSILASKKIKIDLENPLPSFGIEGPIDRPYIEPSFEKIIYETEKPTIILISAVGASGKTALAQQLSRETQLPVLDLGKHEPVGANSLTGLLTTAYNVTDIGKVFQGLSTGTYGVIIDAIDEGRSKTTGKAFEAFMDDIAKLCKTAPVTNLVILGRTRILEDCWAYLTDKGIISGLVTINPFDDAAARKYIDAFTVGISSPYARQYSAARDFVLEKLQNAFSPQLASSGNQFLAFIGYPPVLDAIVTLLNQEQNYHKLLTSLQEEDNRNIEINMLRQVCDYILKRERNDKVIPNIVKPLVADAPSEIAQPALSNAFMPEEQLVRLVAHTLKQQMSLSVVPEHSLNEKYEAQLIPWFPEHPFIRNGEFRNAVFEALALATLMASANSLYHKLVAEYVRTHKHSYHLVYMLDAISTAREVAIDHVNVLLSSAMEFRSVHSVVDIHLNGPDQDEEIDTVTESHEVEIAIDVRIGEDQELAKEFNFRTSVGSPCVMDLGSRLCGIFATLPCDVRCGDGQELEIVAPVEIKASTLRFEAKSLNVKPSKAKNNEDEVIMEAGRVESSVETAVTSGTSFSMIVGDLSGLTYPLIKYATERSRPLVSREVSQKYFRLKRILQEFRSHSRGSLAKYRHKIEHERVLRNDIGRSVLGKLVEDRILSVKGNFYHLDPSRLGDCVGVTWHDLRRGHFPDCLAVYLQSIDT